MPYIIFLDCGMDSYNELLIINDINTNIYTYEPINQYSYRHLLLWKIPMVL